MPELNSFIVIEQDTAGYETLQAINKAPAFNKWMFKTIEPFLYGEILELGSGIGNISQFFIDKKADISLSDNEDEYLELLQKRFPHLPTDKIKKIDLQATNFENDYAGKKYDSIFLMNVLEHLQDDESAIRNCYSLLKPNGTLVILTPAYPWLYSGIDKALHHYRRYTTKTISPLFIKNNFTCKKVFFFNAMGIVAWLYGKMIGLKKVPDGEMKLYNKLVPIGKFLDKVFCKKVGLSIVVVAEKKF